MNPKIKTITSGVIAKLNKKTSRLIAVIVVFSMLFSLCSCKRKDCSYYILYNNSDNYLSYVYKDKESILDDSDLLWPDIKLADKGKAIIYISNSNDDKNYLNYMLLETKEITKYDITEYLLPSNYPELEFGNSNLKCIEPINFAFLNRKLYFIANVQESNCIFVIDVVDGNYSVSPLIDLGFYTYSLSVSKDGANVYVEKCERDCASEIICYNTNEKTFDTVLKSARMYTFSPNYKYYFYVVENSNKEEEFYTLCVKKCETDKLIYSVRIPDGASKFKFSIDSNKITYCTYQQKSNLVGTTNRDCHYAIDFNKGEKYNIYTSDWFTGEVDIILE